MRGFCGGRFGGNLLWGILLFKINLDFLIKATF